jgi:CBS domain-containing protein
MVEPVPAATPLSLSRIGSAAVATAVATTSIAEVARRMEERNVGCIVVVRGAEPVGVVTDRDLVLRVLRRCVDPRSVPVERVMTHPPVVVPDDVDPVAAASLMRRSGVRRLPVVNARRELVGIVTMDDLLAWFGRGHAAIGEFLLDVPRETL